MRRILLFLSFMAFLGTGIAQSGSGLKLALLKYQGGGDWYANPTALPNLSRFCNTNIGTNLDPDYATVEVGSVEIYSYPFIHMTGHGNVIFNDLEAENLRNYLLGGGFLHIDDNYGMDRYVRVAMKKVFPELEFTELPFEHEIYKQTYTFKTGIPKIHKHDDKPAQGFGLFWEGRLICYYSYETDLGDGWEDIEVHKDPPSLRQKSLQMGSNIIEYVFTEQ